MNYSHSYLSQQSSSYSQREPPPHQNLPPPPSSSLSQSHSELSQNELSMLFRAVDKDNDGEISARELQAALSNGTFLDFNPHLCGLMINMFDQRGSGTIHLDEFGALWKYVQDWQNCFSAFDRDNSGSIDSRELHTALSSFGYKLSPSICPTLMTKFDRQGKQTLLFDDFIHCCIIIYTVTNQFSQMDRDRDGFITISYEQFVNTVINIAVNS